MRLSPALSALVVLLAVLLTGCAGSESTPGVAIPDSPVGKQLQWYMGAVKRTPLPESELKEHLSEEFLKGVPAEKFNELAKGLADLKVDELSSTTPTELTGVTSIPLGQKYDMKISVGADGKIDYLLFEPK
ncbi:Cpe/LpqF family protein [Nonomuraea sp. SYSU D8015]|uniref:Cpe/LpqF family protein n=1 Tax=Nonomuraea sp. SYSU D8015 TaxID=2593644 RepID=UPI001660EE91|nr:Cpe/LpqF family protein [Nonomuraea sp. SYSU D8015]